MREISTVLISIASITAAFLCLVTPATITCDSLLLFNLYSRQYNALTDYTNWNKQVLFF